MAVSNAYSGAGKDWSGESSLLYRGIPMRELALLSVIPHSLGGNDLVNAIQMQVDKAVVAGKKIAVFPEGPYCAAVIF